MLWGARMLGLEGARLTAPRRLLEACALGGERASGDAQFCAVAVASNSTLMVRVCTKLEIDGASSNGAILKDSRTYGVRIR